MKYPAGLSGEEYAAMEEGYEQGYAKGRASAQSEVRAALAKADALRPEDFKTGQGHLPPAFREINYHDAFMALAAIVNEAEALLDPPAQHPDAVADPAPEDHPPGAGPAPAGT